MDDKVVKPQMDAPAPEPQVENPNGTVESEPVQTESEPVESTQTDTVAGDMTIPTDPYNTSPLFYEVAQYFGVEQGDYESAKNHLSAIVDYVIMEGKSNRIEDVLVNLRKLEDRLQPPAWDEKRYTNVYKYIRLASKKQSFEKAMSAFEKGIVNG